MLLNSPIAIIKSIIHVNKKDNETLFIIEDFGTGMDEKITKRLFKTGSNPSTLGTMKEKGSDLGLILCKEFVDKHQGRIWVESIKLMGSRFYFTIPEIAFYLKPN